MTQTDDDAAVAQWNRNKYSIYADLGIGALFFVLVKLTDDLPLSALVTAAAGLALVVVQRFVRVDLLGGLAMFGIVVLLLSAAFSFAFDSDWAVKLKSTFLGLLIAALMFGDGLLRGGRYFGLRLGRYMPYPIDPRRLALGMGMLGLVMAALNAVVAAFLSQDVWLYYTSFGDFLVSMLLVFAVLRYARLPGGEHG
jgi:intracellular septation protein A